MFRPCEFYLLAIGGMVCIGLAVAVLVDGNDIDNGEDLVEDIVAFIVEVVVGEGAWVNAPRDVLVEVSVTLFVVDLLLDAVDDGPTIAVDCDDLVVILCFKVEINDAIVEVGRKVVDALVSTENQTKYATSFQSMKILNPACQAINNSFIKTYRGSYMSAYVLLNLLNALRKKD